MEPLELTNYFYVTLVKGKYLLALNRSQNPNTERASIHSFIVSRRKDDSLRPMVTTLPFFSLFFLSPIFVFFAEKVNPRWLQLNLFFLLFLGIPLST